MAHAAYTQTRDKAHVHLVGLQSGLHVCETTHTYASGTAQCALLYHSQRRPPASAAVMARLDLANPTGLQYSELTRDGHEHHLGSRGLLLFLHPDNKMRAH
eukprot:scaffold1396_cov538-Prasinococcus_capsulatus_cf.AAC.1